MRYHGVPHESSVTTRLLQSPERGFSWVWRALPSPFQRIWSGRGRLRSFHFFHQCIHCTFQTADSPLSCRCSRKEILAGTDTFGALGLGLGLGLERCRLQRVFMRLVSFSSIASSSTRHGHPVIVDKVSFLLIDAPIENERTARTNGRPLRSRPSPALVCAWSKRAD